MQLANEKKNLGATARQLISTGKNNEKNTKFVAHSNSNQTLSRIKKDKQTSRRFAERLKEHVPKCVKKFIANPIYDFNDNITLAIAA